MSNTPAKDMTPNGPDLPSRSSDTLGLFKPTRQTRAFEDVVGQIRALLDAGVFKAGDKLPAERDLAAQLAVSRNTVREAIRMLEISGVVELRRGARGGAFVLDPEGDRTAGPLGRSLRFTDVSTADVTQAMRAVTMMLLDAAMPVIDEHGLAELEANLAEAERVADPSERSAVIIRFYEVLAGVTGNRILVELAASMRDILLAWVLRLGSLGSEHVLASRRAIIARLRAHDGDGAKEELNRYLDALHTKWLSGEPY